MGEKMRKKMLVEGCRVMCVSVLHPKNRFRPEVGNYRSCRARTPGHHGNRSCTKSGPK